MQSTILRYELPNSTYKDILIYLMVHYEYLFRIPYTVHRSNWCIALIAVRDHKVVMQLFWERRVILVIAGSRENTMTAPLPRLVRADTTALIASFLANGGKVTVCKPSKRRAGLSASRNRR